MKNNFVLFDSHPFLHPLTEKESEYVRKVIHEMAHHKNHLPKIPLPSVISDHMILYFIKSVKDQNLMILNKVWVEFLENLFYQGLMKQLHSPSLRNYLMIQMAKSLPLSHFADEVQRKKLAYAALHGGDESRRILLEHIKHFELSDPNVLSDIAFKGILLGGANFIDLHQFLPLPSHVVKQLLFLIAKVSPEKAQKELKKISSHFPDMESFKDLLAAS